MAAAVVWVAVRIQSLDWELQHALGTASHFKKKKGPGVGEESESLLNFFGQKLLISVKVMISLT